MKVANLIFLFTLFTMHVFAQNCENSKFLKEGTKWEISNYDKKEKLTSISKYESVSEKTTANGMNWVLKMESVDKKGEEILPQSTVTIVCENGIYQMDMSDFIPAEVMQSFQNMEVEMESSELNFPSIKDVNSKLSDGTIKITTFSSGVKLMTMNLTITDRIIEGTENIETEAGNFECLKISQKTIVETGMIKRTMESTNWFLPQFGVIRSENYHKNGKTTSSSQLSSLTLP